MAKRMKMLRDGWYVDYIMGTYGMTWCIKNKFDENEIRFYETENEAKYRCNLHNGIDKYSKMKKQ